MATIQHASLQVDELTRILKGVDPTAFLVPPRVLRRVIKYHYHLGGMGLFVPHRKSCIIDRESLLEIADRDEIGAAPHEELPLQLILLARPEPENLARITVDEALFKHWRLLFHARLDWAMQQKLADGTLSPVNVRPRIQKLGSTEFDEIAFVMHQERFLLPPETPERIYAEFVAVYLTLQRFAKNLLPHFFPCLRDHPFVNAMVNAEVDVEAIYAATRLPGAPETEELPPDNGPYDPLQNPPPDSMLLARKSPVGDKIRRWLEAKGDTMDAKGNNVRAAVLRYQAAGGGKHAPAEAHATLTRLCQRLQSALELSDVDAENWRMALLPLLPRACRGSWSQEARFLYDLQKTCVDKERGIFTIDPVEWALSMGRRPLKRPLPGHQAVAIVRHLRQALDRMQHIRLANGERQALMALLLHAVERREGLMRDRFRPLIARSLQEVGLKPQNVPEELGQAKLIEELLDRLVDYGHLNMGTLRDAISRNQLKLPDLSGPVQLIQGDPFLRLNRKLGVALDGVYRRGEIYMRLLHRISSVAFGTPAGRLLMLYLVIPLGLGFFTVVAPGLVVEEVPRLIRFIGRVTGLLESPLARPAELTSAVGILASPQGGPWLAGSTFYAQRFTRHEHHGLEWPELWLVGTFGIFYLLLIHVARFRSSFYYGVGRLGHLFHAVFIDAPLWFLHLPLIQAIFKDRFWQLFRRFVFWPLALGAAGAWWASVNDEGPIGIAFTCACFWITTIVLLNSRLGRDLEETITDRLMFLWQRFSIDFLPGLLRLIMDWSRRFLEAVEQVIYTVDEWLRFKTDENLPRLVFKAVLTVVWFAVTYIIRFAINLLIEPQINPIKHFPVVTVSHKICLPMIPMLGDVLMQHFGLARTRAFGLATGIITGIPGIFGFAAWELKENWRLYRGNRPTNLGPEGVGSHGETMLRLLRPGFHSGTVPKLYRKLRRAERRGQKRKTRNILAGLHHVKEDVAHFFERELLGLLRQSKGWKGLTIKLAAIRLGINRIAVQLNCPELDSQPLVLGIDHHSGWLLAGVLEPAWLPKLTREQRQTLAAALAGVYKLAGIDLTREQIAEGFAPTPVAFDICGNNLAVWPCSDITKESTFDLAAGPVLQPHETNGALAARQTNGAMTARLRPLDTSWLLFTNTPISWQEWVQTWDRDRSLVNGDVHELPYAILPSLSPCERAPEGDERASSKLPTS
jgi:hypothetical protein